MLQITSTYLTSSYTISDFYVSIIGELSFRNMMTLAKIVELIAVGVIFFFWVCLINVYDKCNKSSYSLSAGPLIGLNNCCGCVASYSSAALMSLVISNQASSVTAVMYRVYIYTINF